MPAILPPCKLLEFDFSGIELVILGWYCARLTGDPMVIRFGKLGVHGLVASHLVGKPPDMAWPDQQLGEYFQEIKDKYPDQYDTSKRTVHGTGYGLTPEGAVLQFPGVYRDLKHAKQVQQVYYTACPSVPAFQLDAKKRAAKQNFLGGPIADGLDILTDLNAHPFTYQHAFWNVVDYRKLSPLQARAVKEKRSAITSPIIEIEGTPYAMLWGPDAKRALAFYPQSTAAGVLDEAEVELFDEPESRWYIADAYYGRTPLRAPIHDSLFLEVPFRKIDRVIECVSTVMTQPIRGMPMRPEWQMGEYLTINVEGKIGDDWGTMEKIVAAVGVGSDVGSSPTENEEEEEWQELRTAV
jgi:hypothetical protein